MDTVNTFSDIYHEGLAETLEDPCGELGLCCSLEDEMAHELGRNLDRTVTVYARGVGKRVVRLQDVQGDVLCAMDIEQNKRLYIPLCAIYLFYQGTALPLEHLPQMSVRLDGGGSCRGCCGMIPELQRHIGAKVGVILPQESICLKILRASRLIVYGISGEAAVALRVGCIDALEIAVQE